VTARRDRDDGLWLTVAVGPGEIERFVARFGNNIRTDPAIRRAS